METSFYPFLHNLLFPSRCLQKNSFPTLSQDELGCVYSGMENHDINAVFNSMFWYYLPAACEAHPAAFEADPTASQTLPAASQTLPTASEALPVIYLFSTPY